MDLPAERRPRPLDAARIAVIGDLSGHLRPLLKVLRGLGVVFDGPAPDFPREVVSFPDDLVVIQVGDLVHKGPDSDINVAVVHDLLLPTGRWVQLAGNHEVQYLPGGTPFWRPPVGARTAEALQQMWADGRMRAAVAVDDVELGPVLVTHAGITPARYEQALNRLERSDADQLNAGGHVAVAGWLNRAPDDVRARRAVFTPGAMAGRSDEPGVAWTEPRGELRHAWLRWAKHDSVLCDPEDRRPLPFSQVHGHAQPLLLVRGRGLRVPDDLAGFTVIEPGTRHVVSSFASVGPARELVGIDPGANSKRVAAPRPRMLTGVVHV